MKILKNRLFIFILGGILFSSITAFAVNTISASQITYTDKNNVEKTVDVVLDDLYDKANSQKTATQVATLTTQGATYTMQNDGYIIGTASSSNGKNAILYFNDNSNYILAPFNTDSIYPVSLYITKNTSVATRSDGGIYNLTVYEWK